MTRRESRGLLVLVITLVALISGGILAYKNPDSWHGLALLIIGFVGCCLCYKRWQIATKATPAEKQDEENRTTIGMWLMVLFVIAAFLEVVAIGVGLILNTTMDGELGHTIIQYAVYIGGVFAALFLGFLLFFA
jgi:heme/copper-type cytochrome/quinol oxidase subunit 2